MKIFSLLCGLFLLAMSGIHGRAQSKTAATVHTSKAYLADSAQFETVRDYCDSMVNLKRYPEAISGEERLLQIAERLGNPIFTGRAYMFGAYIERSQNNNSQALVKYQKALAEFNTAGQAKRQIRVLQLIAGIYLNLHELDLAEYYCKRALDIIKTNGFKIEKAHIYTDLATLEDIRKNYSKALNYNAEALKIMHENGAESIETLFNRCIILKNAGLYQKSVDSYFQCLQLAKQQKNKIVEGFIYVNLPNSLLALNRLDEAESYIKKALEWSATQAQDFTREDSIYETLTKVYEKKGDFRRAFSYQKQWHNYRDSIFNDEKSRQLIETETRFQTREKQQQIQKLDEDNITKKNQLLWLTAGVSLLVILLGVALWQYFKIQKVNHRINETNTTLNNANRKISIQSGQLKELMQELHHRVKNNLAIISSLLYLQANRLDDKKAVQAVLDGQQRVEAMSLIHQQLYQTDNVTNVSMKEYIGDLVQGLTQSFHFNEKLHLFLDIEDISLDVELAVPLGLIINELVTNVFKHAFLSVDEPELCIRLWQDEQLYLEIRDNGPGLDPQQWKKAGQTFGKRLVISLTKQANGSLDVTAEQGTKFLLTLPPVNKGIPEFSLAGNDY